MSDLISGKVEVLAVKPWNEQEPEKYGRFIRVKFDGHEDTRRYTLDRSLNGAADALIGKAAVLSIATVMKAYSYEGSSDVKYKEQLRVVGLKAA